MSIRPTVPRLTERLAVVHIVSADLWAGAESVTYQIIREQNSNKSVDLLAILLNQGEMADRLRTIGIKVAVIDESELSFFRLIRSAYKLCRMHEADVIHTHRLKENVIGSICCALIWKSKSIRTVHGIDEYSDSLFSFTSVVKRISDLACAVWPQSAVVFVSSELRECLKSQYQNAKQFVINNGIDVEDIESARFLKILLPGRGSTIRVLWAGRLSRVKRPELFIEAANQIGEKGIRFVEFYLAGDGPMHETCREMIGAENLEGFVHLLGFRSDIESVIRSVDIVVICSDHEGLPMILLESMALETLVVSRGVGEIPSVLGGGKYGVLWDPENQSLANILLETISTLHLEKDRIANAKAHVSENYSITDTARMYVRLYRRLLAQTIHE